MEYYYGSRYGVISHFALTRDLVLMSSCTISSSPTSAAWWRGVLPSLSTWSITARFQRSNTTTTLYRRNSRVRFDIILYMCILTLSCCGSVLWIRPRSLNCEVPDSNLLAAAVAPLGKVIYPHWLVPRNGLKSVGALVACYKHWWWQWHFTTRYNVRYYYFFKIMRLSDDKDFKSDTDYICYLVFHF